MKTRRTKNLLSAAACAALCLPGAAPAAIQLAGETLQVYGRLHLSLDLSHADSDGAPGSPPDGMNLSLSNNASYLGFAGRHALDPQWTLLWQVEQSVKPDEGSGDLASRNSFLGVSKEGVGTVLAGHYDTPFKTMGKRWAVLNYTVADRRSILGAGAISNNVMNQRAKNALAYLHTVEDVEFQLMYATDGQDSRPGFMDDNDNDVFSAAAWLTLGQLELSAAYEHWSRLHVLQDSEDLAASGRADGLRIAMRHNVSEAGHVGVILEIIDTSAAIADLDRSVFGMNGSYRVGGNVFEAQLLYATDRRGVSNSGAVNLGLGMTRSINPQTQVYGAFSFTANESNARYPVAGGGHGDRVDTVPGGTPFSLSAGVVFRF